MTAPKSKLQWFARCKDIAKMGPYSTQEAALRAVITTNGLPAPEAFVWPETLEEAAQPGSAKLRR